MASWRPSANSHGHLAVCTEPLGQRQVASGRVQALHARVPVKGDGSEVGGRSDSIWAGWPCLALPRSLLCGLAQPDPANQARTVRSGRWRRRARPARTGSCTARMLPQVGSMRREPDLTPTVTSALRKGMRLRHCTQERAGMSRFQQQESKVGRRKHASIKAGAVPAYYSNHILLDLQPFCDATSSLRPSAPWTRRCPHRAACPACRPPAPSGGMRSTAWCPSRSSTGPRGS